MKQYLFFISFLFSSLCASSQDRNSVDVDITKASKIVNISVDDFTVDVLIRGISGSFPTVTIRESLVSDPRKMVVTSAFMSSKAIPYPVGATTKAVRISLTKNSYSIGDPTKPFNELEDSEEKKPEVLLSDNRPWNLPLEILIQQGGSSFIVKIYKSFSYTGSVLLDAARLDSLRDAKDPTLYSLIQRYDPGAKATTKDALKRYFGDTISITLTSARNDDKGIPLTIPAKVVRNPYLADLMDKLIASKFPDPSEPGPTHRADFTAGGGQGRGTSGNAFGSLSDPALLADALATFIARRFKEEVNIAFLNEFRKKLEIDSTLGLILPSTKRIMLSIDPYEYTTFLESMKTAFAEDLSQLPTHSATLLDTLSARKKIKFNDRLVLSRVALQTLQRTLDNRTDYWGALRSIPMSSLVGSSDTLTSVLLTGSLSVNSVLDTMSKVRLPNAKVFVKQADYKDLVLGLLLARYDTTLQHIQIKVGDTKPLEAATFLSYALHTRTGDYTKVIDVTNGLGKALLTFDELLKQLRKKVADEKTLSDGAKLQGKQFDEKLASYSEYALTLTGAFDQMLTLDKLFPSLPSVKIRQRILAPVISGIQAFKFIQEKQYALAVINTANMLIALTSGDNLTDSRTTAALKKYGSFMTSIVAAETRDQMLEALGTAALPVGSYRIKRNNYFSVAVNTYGGIATGLESVREITTPTSITGVTNGGWVIAPYAPLGISMAWGRNADYVNQRDHASLGIHVNLLDVGALAAVRVSNETVSLPEFTWGNLLAPGLQFMYGFPKSVWTVSAGAQLGPELRKVNLDQGKNIIDTKQWRIGVTLSADIPLFNVFTQANHRKIATLNQSSLEISAGRPVNAGVPHLEKRENELRKRAGQFLNRADRKRARIEKKQREEQAKSLTQPANAQ